MLEDRRLHRERPVIDECPKSFEHTRAQDRKGFVVREARFAILIALAILFAASGSAVAQEDRWYDRQAEWNGYQQYHFTVAERKAYIVVPTESAAGKPWVWRARFPGYHAEMDIQLLADGYHIGYVDVAGLFGGPSAIAIGDAFYEFVTNQRGLARRPALEGVSRGGLFVYNWAAQNPDKVACIYCDTPVCDFRSWPGGLGDGIGASSEWSKCLAAYELTEESAEAFRGLPIDHAEKIGGANIPLLHIVSENDRVVPPNENTYLLKARLEKHGHEMEVISVTEGTERSNGHHFAHPDPQRVVRFIKRHTSTNETSVATPSTASQSERMDLIRNAKRILFLGDSITYAGGYIASFDTWLETMELEAPPVVIDAGLPSETVSGLSEEGHAGGRFPRPDLAERLDRILEATNPDLVFACYGINCGIYQPFDAERFKKYQEGILRLRTAVEEMGATLVLVTPPSYDDQRSKNEFSYNGVLDKYSEWLLQQRDEGWLVIDLHRAMSSELARRRETDPDFTFQPDAVHPNEDGHWYIATHLMKWFGDDASADHETMREFIDANAMPPETAKQIRERLNLRRDAYLSAAGHLRPGIRAGLPINEAEMKANELTEEIRNR